MDSRVYWIWLQQALGPGAPQTAPLLRLCGNAQGVYDADEDVLRQVNLTRSQMARLREKDLEKATACLKETLAWGGWVLTPDDALFPSMLRGIYAPPLVLYGRGTMPNLEQIPAITVVGTRKCTDYGVHVTSRLTAGLVAGGFCIVSGGAKGIDVTALRKALECDATAICIQACGLDVDYPTFNTQMRRDVLRRGALLSEYPLGTPALTYHFRPRNRLLSGISHGTCVTEAPIRSGALITARHALEQGRDVFAVPGPVFSYTTEGTNQLIREGACLITGVADVMREYAGRFKGRLHMDAAVKAEAAFDRAVKLEGRPTVEKAEEKAAPSQKPTPSKKSTPSKKAEKSAKPREWQTVVQTLPEPLLSAVADTPPTACPDYVSDNAKRMYKRLLRIPQPIDELAAAEQLPVHQALAALTELEIAGCAAMVGGGQYTIQ